MRRGHLFRDQRNSIALSFFKVTFFPCQIRDLRKEEKRDKEEKDKRIISLVLPLFAASEWRQREREREREKTKTKMKKKKRRIRQVVNESQKKKKKDNQPLSQLHKS